MIELDPVEFSLELGSMLASAALTLALPLRALRRGVLQLPRDSVFLLFWAQAWLYVHAVPTLNAAFPHAIGAAGPLERAIQFQADDVFNYAQLQIASTFLFFAPMLWLYGRWVRRDSDATFRASISPLRLGGLGAAFSVFGAVYIRTANANGLLSPYAASVGRFLSLPRIDYFVIRVYQVSAVFLFLVIAIAFLRMTAGATQKLLVAALAAPGAACFATHVLCSGRTAAVFASALLLSAVASCGSLAGMTRKGVARGLAVVVPLLAYAMIVIPRVRIIVTYKDFELAEVAESMQPFGSAPRRFAVEKYYRGYGTRLDGLELMAVATPQLLRYGLDFGVMWLTPALAPVAPLFPDWERNLKSAGELDVKLNYMRKYAPAIAQPDYTSCSLTEPYIAFGHPGLLLPASFFALALAHATLLLRRGSKPWSLAVGLFLVASAFQFEQGFLGLCTAWVRGTPSLALALLFNPFRAASN